MKNFEPSKKVNKFYYSAITQHSNAGDALINRELIKLMRSVGIVNAYIGDSPKSFLKEIQLEDGEILKVSGFFSLILIILLDRIKGNIIYLVQTPGDISAKSNTILDFFKTFLIMILSLLGVKVVQVGISLGEFSKVQKINYRLRSMFMYAIGLRDNISINKALDMKLKNYIYFPDLAFGVEPILKNNENIFKIGFSFRNDNLSEDKQNTLIENLKKEFFNLKEIKFEISLIVQVERDLFFAKRISQEVFLNNCNIIECYSIYELDDYYSNLDLVISNRLHVILLAGLNGALSIAYVDPVTNKKIIGLLENLGLVGNIEYQKNKIDIQYYVENYVDLKNNFFNNAKNENIELNTIFKRVVDGQFKNE